MAKWLLFILLSGALAITVKSQLVVGNTCRTNVGEAGTCSDPARCHDWINRQLQLRRRVINCTNPGVTPVITCCPNKLVGGRLGYQTEASRNSKSYRKCLEYANVLNKVEDIPIPLAIRPPTVSQECHISHDGTQLIAAGTLTQKYEFPHMALLGFGERLTVQWLCGGSLISSRFVLTAAHCLYSRYLNRAVDWVRLGATHVNDSAHETGQLLQVKRRIHHEEYTSRYYYNDIALIELEDDVVYSKAVRPACIHHLDGDTSPNLHAIVTGWGFTENGGPTSSVLLKAELRFLSQIACRDAYTNLAKLGRKLKNNINNVTQVCAGDPKGKADTCQGDSGGPIQLVLHEPTCMYVVVGVTSFGPITCGGENNTPAVYTRLKSYIPWIESKVWPN